jgi:hypothetical protein
MTPAGFPHSGTLGSKPARRLPEAIAANSALHRLLAPGHPPCALTSLKRTNYRSSCIELAQSHASSDDACDQHYSLVKVRSRNPGGHEPPSEVRDEQPLITASGKGCDEDTRGAPGQLLADPAELPTAGEPRRPISP